MKQNLTEHSVYFLWGTPDFLLRHKEDLESGIWLEYQTRKAILLLNCFGKSELIADMLIRFWESLTASVNTVISPIKAENILPLFAVHNSYFSDLNRADLAKATQWFQHTNVILEAMRKIEGGSKVSNNTFNITAKNIGCVGNEGDTFQKNTHNDYSQKLTIEEKESVLAALTKLQNNLI